MADGGISYFAVTDTLVKPLVEAVNSGLETMIPIGIGIMGTFIGISLRGRMNVLSLVFWAVIM